MKLSVLLACATAGTDFATRYATLKGCGGKHAPALDKATVERARAPARCG